MECGMERRFHRGFTAAEKTELWDRWKRGESLKAIGRAFGKQSSSIYFLVAPHGGIRPAERRRSRLALTLAEREEISRGVTAHQSARSIAKLLGRSPSTLSREMSRNGGYDRYRATLADENAWARSRRPKCCKLATNPRLRQAVAGKLRLDWSPEQIAGWLKRTHPEDECNRVSHETIYRSLFVQARGVLKNQIDAGAGQLWRDNKLKSSSRHASKCRFKSVLLVENQTGADTRQSGEDHPAARRTQGSCAN
ncbi:Helix-turn-helix domain-containing protein [Bradyrhizobium erythrophlei]|nr:Helix-turn-helix domain-containing protein [Bradyrhizobium erythrophlei]